jgi:hypothetical protein
MDEPIRHSTQVANAGAGREKEGKLSAATFLRIGVHPGSAADAALLTFPSSSLPAPN